MDLKKIGKFIIALRNEAGFTQESLAEKLDVSNRSVSKWERGVCLPDPNNMTKLCKLFDINYNELLSGQRLKTSEYEKRAEENLKEFSEIETAQNKKLLFYENVIGYMSSVAFLVLVFTASYVEMPIFTRIILFVFGFILLIVGASFCLKIETETGKYKCKNCGHCYVPKYSTVYLAQHIGRTRKMRCPKCGKKSWSKKVV
ncbi:helix-turn-helix domain-containing protein [Candidatus Saccharibacteria bacterium]|nr:helix-turn-helix domain-containing protein [Candidatus Saccharibacteria bacterium]